MYALLVFIMATLEISFDLRGLFGGCILKKSASVEVLVLITYIILYLSWYLILLVNKIF